jgi:broad specificity phosphatase PhoE
MAELYLVRHAQASFGTEDYDRLTELGHRQARWLGEYFAERQMRFDRVLTGTLRRHRETLAGIVEGNPGAPAAELHPGLDEYRAEALVAAYARARSVGYSPGHGDRREHFRLLRSVLYEWCDGTLDAEGHLCFADFVSGARSALEAARRPGAERVLVVSSGGPISALVCSLVDAPPRRCIDLNLQARNSGVSEVRFNERAVHLVSFNNVPHLDRPGRSDAITYS